jgi:hypothetical protein
VNACAAGRDEEAARLGQPCGEPAAQAFTHRG